MLGNVLSIVNARKRIDYGINAMFLLIESFTNEQLDDYFKQNNMQMKSQDLKDMIYETISIITNDLLTIREDEYYESKQNDNGGKIEKQLY